MEPVFFKGMLQLIVHSAKSLWSKTKWQTVARLRGSADSSPWSGRIVEEADPGGEGRGKNSNSRQWSQGTTYKHKTYYVYYSI